jgi:hypothetical protein
VAPFTIHDLDEIQSDEIFFEYSTTGTFIVVVVVIVRSAVVVVDIIM